MSNSLLITLAILAILIIAGLAFYAGKLLFQLKQHNLKVKEHLAQQVEAQIKKDKDLVFSIQTIAKAVCQQQCDVGEAAIRLSVLLSHLSNAMTEDYPKQYPSLHNLNEKIKHLAILEARKKLDKKERMRQDYIRVQAEAEYQELVTDEAERLSDFKLA